MNASSIPSQAEDRVLSEAAFDEWLDETRTPALISTSKGQYHAFCVEFGIAGSGATKDAAIQDATDLLMRYLAVSFSEGRAYRDSKKPPPPQVRARLLYLRARARFLRRIRPSLSRLGGLISVPTTDHETHRLAH